MHHRTLATASALALSLACAASAQAQAVVREAPAGVRAARMVITLPPQLTLDGQPARLSPGARIRDTRNLMALSASLAGRDLPVVYRTDPLGLVHEVWLLTEDEYARLAGTDPLASAESAARFKASLDRLFATRP